MSDNPLYDAADSAVVAGVRAIGRDGDHSVLVCMPIADCRHEPPSGRVRTDLCSQCHAPVYASISVYDTIFATTGAAPAMLCTRCVRAGA